MIAKSPLSPAQERKSLARVLGALALCSIFALALAWVTNLGKEASLETSFTAEAEPAFTDAAADEPRNDAGQAPGANSGGAIRPPLTPRAGPHRVRPPAAAGTFYPEPAEELSRAVDRLLRSGPRLGLRGVRAVLVPHAGYVYSGMVAAASFREVDPGFRRVFLLAANHNGDAHFDGASLPDESHYAIPGAEIPLSPVVDELAKDDLFVSVPAAHTMHMIEVELPFLTALRGRPAPTDFEIIPIVVGRMDWTRTRRLAALLERYDDPATLFVFSVDLSHFHPDAEARKLDEYSIQSLLALDENALDDAETDGDQVLQTLAALADRRGWEPSFLAYRNSADAGGDKDRVVGYAAIAFHAPFDPTEEERRTLLALARTTIEEFVSRGSRYQAPAEILGRWPILRLRRCVFVTLTKRGVLRGCIGGLTEPKPLWLGVRDAAIGAATEDPRFPAVRPEEIADLSIEISILTQPRRIRVEDPERYPEVLRPGQDGVILEVGSGRSTFLPTVWRQIPQPEEFLRQLCRKQGAEPDAWRSTAAVLHRYGTCAFGEAPEGR